MLADVATAPGEDRLVVNAVLRAGAPRQFILLHRSVQGGTSPGEPGATVTVRGPAGEVRFTEEQLDGFPATSACGFDAESEQTGTCYTSPASAGAWVEPGWSYELEVVTRRGERVRGRTEVPPDFHWAFAPRPETGEAAVCELPPNTPFSLVWTRSAGAFSYVSELLIYDLPAALAGSGIPTENVPDPLDLFGLTISDADTTQLLPGSFGLFQRGDFDQRLLAALQKGFPPGSRATLTLAAADRNYVNGIRGGSFNPSGPVQIPSVAGDGTGVFGSVNPIGLRVRVRDGPVVCGNAPLGGS